VSDDVAARQQSRQDYGAESREDWQAHQEGMQDDRQQWADAELDDHYYGGYYGHGVVVVDDDDDDAAAALMAGLALGTVVTAAAMQSATTRSTTSGTAPACTMTKVTVGSDIFYKCGSNWFQKALANGEVTYVVVKPPPGF
jgi:hypothetical protein